jgi:hypothetical protein
MDWHLASRCRVALGAVRISFGGKPILDGGMLMLLLLLLLLLLLRPSLLFLVVVAGFCA